MSISHRTHNPVVHMRNGFKFSKLHLHQQAVVCDEITHFSYPEAMVLLNFFYTIENREGEVDRHFFREILHSVFGITDDQMLDLIFHAFDINSDGIIEELEFVQGLSLMFRGTVEELIKFCYRIFDVNGDGSLTKHELEGRLKGCLLPGWGLPLDEMDEGEREVIDMAHKLLDTDKDGLITFKDYRTAVYKDPLLLESFGQCLVEEHRIIPMLFTITKDHRSFTAKWGTHWAEKALPPSKSSIFKSTPMSLWAPNKLEHADDDPTHDDEGVHFGGNGPHHHLDSDDEIGHHLARHHSGHGHSMLHSASTFNISVMGHK